MDRRFALFAVLVALIFVVNNLVFSLLFPPEPAKEGDQAVAQANAKPGEKAPDAQLKPAAEPADEKPAEAEPGDAKPAEGEPADEPAAEQPADKSAEPEKPAEKEPEIAPKRGSIGSSDPATGYRMLVTWNNQGAALERVSLNSPRYRDLDDRSGTLGYLAPADAPKRAGARVRVVGPGTPAAIAGLQVDDVITGIGNVEVRTAGDFVHALAATEPGQVVEVAIDRGGAQQKFSATLAHRPLNLARAEFETQLVESVEPGNHDPLSFLTTIAQCDDRTLSNDNKELGGVNLRSGAWEVVQSGDDFVTFRRRLPTLGLEIAKTYKLAKAPPEELENPDYPAYGLTMEVSVTNVDDKPHQVAYRQDGPTGLPIEGAWFASKVSRTWKGAGLRDVLVKFHGGSIEQVSPAQLFDPEFKQDWGAVSSLDFIAVDAQYFASAVIPAKKEPTDILFQSIMPLRVGELPQGRTDTRLLNVSFRMDSKTAELQPGGPALTQTFEIFAGPKRADLLAQYGQPDASLSSLIYFGWPMFAFFARLLSVVLHFFYGIIGNYGLAIIMLTVLVRGMMFPISRKQALGAQKMAELQPEMKRISEKYKSDPQKRTQATQELFRQHKYNPLGGCLLAFVQLPIFVGLYRSLMVDVELRQAPLISESIRWASNLAAPDMFWHWQPFMPAFVTEGTGIFALGPYLNILPLFTVGLFIWQQKMFMPPPADEQAALQQKMMQYMMIFMGVLFFKVASGLCVYFIASSLWGITERKMLPKPQPKPGTSGSDGGGGASVPAVSPSGNGSTSSKKKQRGRR